jgi:pyridoxamine 5'-phosphate oxidase-like protein
MMPKEYGLAGRRSAMLPWTWARRRLVAAHNYWISTTRPDGRPHAMPVWGLWLDETFLFSTSRRSRKVAIWIDGRRPWSTSNPGT